MGSILLQAFGWLGSAVLVFSVLQSRFLRFRLINGVASAMLMAYNAALGVWPAVAMNAVLVAINAYFLLTLVRSKRARKAFTYLLDAATGEAVGWFLARHGADVATYHPALAPRLAEPGTQAALLFHEDAAIGLDVFRPDGDGVAELLADYVIPAYRDFTPGEFVFSAAGPLRQAGVRHVWIGTPSPHQTDYLARMGFRRAAGGARLDLSLA